MNRIKLTGNTGADAQIRATAGGTPVTSVRLATGRKFTDRTGAEREEVQWHTVVAWGPLALLVGNLPKGTRLEVEGELKYRTYQDRDDVTRTVAEIHALEVTATRRISVTRRAEQKTA